jgi:hypothetical protein
MRASSQGFSRTRLQVTLLPCYTPAPQFDEPWGGAIRLSELARMRAPTHHSSSQVATHTSGAFQLIATSFSE